MIVQTDTYVKPRPVKPPHVPGISRDRLLVLERGGFRCAYCDADLLGSLQAFHSATCDHVWPKAHGGHGGPNLVACCGVCNKLKADYKASSFEDAQAHVAAKRAECVAFFLEVLDYFDVDLPDQHAGERTFQKDLICSLGTFAGEVDALRQRLAVFESRAATVLKQFEDEPIVSPLDAAGALLDRPSPGI